MIVLRERASAKVNLYLHITARRADGYHLLDSLTGFTDAADTLEAVPAAELTLTLKGPYAQQVPAQDNSVIKAAEILRRHAGIMRGAALTLEKHLPVAAGVGGGSADAAATLRLLMRLWDIHPSRDALLDLALTLGADVPACLRSTSLYMEGVGEKIHKGPPLTGMHAVLVNPGTPLATPDVFAGFRPPFSTPARHPGEFATFVACVGFLKKCRNDLEGPATLLLPEIATVLEALNAQQGCGLARMSGSGATCFGLFAESGEAEQAALALGSRHAKWWVRKTVFL